MELKSVLTKNLKKKLNRKEKRASGLIDDIISKLPEIHLHGYQFCGPGTKLEDRLTQGQKGINNLDNYCMYHDIAYESTDSDRRYEADANLISYALLRIVSENASLGERLAAFLILAIIGAKMSLSKIGLGIDDNHKKKKSR